MLSEAQIKSAIRSAPRSGKTKIELKDDGERGAGRLALLIRPTSSRSTAEWYAVYYRGGRRVMLKIGLYPLLSLADARKRFREEYAPIISSGTDPTSRYVRRHHRGAIEGATVTELFRAYVDSLKNAGKRSWNIAERILLSSGLGAAETLGAERLASSITPADLVGHLATIHDRGSVCMADQTRAYLNAAFSFGFKSMHDYTAKGTAANWGISTNPVEAIKTDPTSRRVGQRFLTVIEFKTLWDWTEAYDGSSQFIQLIQLLLATGQRVEEILRITDKVFDPDMRMLKWDKTKNTLPHAIPISPRAVSILLGLTTNRHGLYFPHLNRPTEPAPYDSVQHMTWKTLAGDAGISKEMRDRLQNHAKPGDVSGRHYDRYDYLTEKRAAVAVWANYMDRVLAGEIKVIGEHAVVVPIRQGAPVDGDSQMRAAIR
jgi:integrase